MYPPKDTEKNLRKIIGEDIFAVLDLSQSVVTGLSLLAACYRRREFSREDHEKVPIPFEDSLLSVYPAYTSVPRNFSQYRRVVNGSEITVIPLDGHVSAYSKDPEGKTNTVTLDLEPIFDTNIYVLATGEEYHTITEGHIKNILKLHPHLKVRETEGSYEITDPKFAIRPIRIHSGSIESIMASHVAPLRSWCMDEKDEDGKMTRSIYVTSTFVHCLIKSSMTNYYMFPEDQYPINILERLRNIGIAATPSRRLGSLLSLHSDRTSYMKGVCMSCKPSFRIGRLAQNSVRSRLQRKKIKMDKEDKCEECIRICKNGFNVFALHLCGDLDVKIICDMRGKLIYAKK